MRSIWPRKRLIEPPTGDLEDWVRRCFQGTTEALREAERANQRAAELERQVEQLQRQLSGDGSNPPPGVAEVKKEGARWRVRAPSWVAALIALAITVAMLAKELRALWGLVAKP